MGPQNLNPLDELRSLDQQVELVNDLAGLKPIFFRLEEIAKQKKVSLAWVVREATEKYVADQFPLFGSSLLRQER